MAVTHHSLQSCSAISSGPAITVSTYNMCPCTAFIQGLRCLPLRSSGPPPRVVVPALHAGPWGCLSPTPDLLKQDGPSVWQRPRQSVRTFTFRKLWFPQLWFFRHKQSGHPTHAPSVSGRHLQFRRTQNLSLGTTPPFSGCLAN